MEGLDRHTIAHYILLQKRTTGLVSGGGFPRRVEPTCTSAPRCVRARSRPPLLKAVALYPSFSTSKSQRAVIQHLCVFVLYVQPKGTKVALKVTKAKAK